jgi:hypothetical protein
MTQRYFEEAETQYDEFKGTSAFDRPQTRSLDEVSQLPKGKYMVLGFSLFGGSAVGGLDHEATAYVVELSSIPNYASLEETARSNGGVVPVIEILTLVSMKQVLELCKQVSIRAETQGVHEAGWRLRIDRQLDWGQAADDVVMEAEEVFDEDDDDT